MPCSLPLSPTSPMGSAQDAFRSPPASLNASLVNAASRQLDPNLPDLHYAGRQPDMSSRDRHYAGLSGRQLDASPRDIHYATASGRPSDAAPRDIHYAGASSRNYVGSPGRGGGSSMDSYAYAAASNAPSTYAIALSSPLSARGKPPYFPDESGRSASKGFADHVQGGMLCNFCKNNGEREAMFR